MNDKTLTEEQLEEIRERKISSYIFEAEELLRDDIDRMRHASISGEVSKHNEVTGKIEKRKIDKEYAKNQQERLDKSLRSLQKFMHLLDTVEGKREALYEAQKDLIPLEVAKEKVDEKIEETYGDEKDRLGRSQSKKTEARIEKPYGKERTHSLQKEVEEYQKALKELDKYLSSPDSAVRRDKNGKCTFSFFHLTSVEYGKNPFRKNEKGERVSDVHQYADETLGRYLQDIAHELSTFKEKNEEENKNEYKVDTPEVDKIRDAIEFYESDKFHGVRVVVHGKHLLEKMTERERLVSSIDKALDELGDLKGFDETRKALEELKRQEELNFEKSREHFEKESGYQGIVQAIEKDKAIDQYAELIRKQRAAGSEREAYLLGQELEKLQGTLGLTAIEVSEATKRVDREEEAKRADEQIEKSEQMAKEAAKNERIDRELAAHETGLAAVEEEFRRGHFRGPDFTGTGYNEQQISEETKRAEEDFARDVYEETYHQAVKPGLPEHEERITDTEEYQEAERTREELRQGVISYLTEEGRKPDVVQSEVDAMVSSMMSGMDMTPKERAIETLRREGNRLFDENTTAHDLNPLQRQQVDAQMRIEERTGITASLDKMSKAKKERERRDKEGYGSSSMSTSDNSEHRKHSPSTSNFEEAKAGYEERVAKRDQEKVDRRQTTINVNKQTVSDELETVDYQAESEETKRGAHK